MFWGWKGGGQRTGRKFRGRGSQTKSPALPRFDHQWAGSGSTWFALILHVGERSTAAPISTQTLQKISVSIHAMDQITALYALLSFLALLISSVGFFNQNSDWDIP